MILQALKVLQGYGKNPNVFEWLWGALRGFQMLLYKSAYVQNFESKLVIFSLIVHQSEAIFLKPSEKMHLDQ